MGFPASKGAVQLMFQRLVFELYEYAGFVHIWPEILTNHVIFASTDTPFMVEFAVILISSPASIPVAGSVEFGEMTMIVKFITFR